MTLNIEPHQMTQALKGLAIAIDSFAFTMGIALVLGLIGTGISYAACEYILKKKDSK